MDHQPRGELQNSNPKYILKAHTFGGNKLQPEQRRQDKMIGAMVRKLPRVLLLDSIIITPQERMAFEARWSTKRLDRWKDSDIEQALSALPLPTMQEENIRQPVKTFKRFEGNETLQRRMRRVVSLVTRGTPATPDVVNPYDLYNFVKNKCRNAVAFERKIPEILQALDTAGLGAGNYHEAVNEIGVTLFGSQWVYLQQLRLVEAVVTAGPNSAAEPVPQTPSIRAKDAGEISQRYGELQKTLRLPSSLRDLHNAVKLLATTVSTQRSRHHEYSVRQEYTDQINNRMHGIALHAANTILHIPDEAYRRDTALHTPGSWYNGFIYHLGSFLLENPDENQFGRFKETYERYPEYTFSPRIAQIIQQRDGYTITPPENFDDFYKKLKQLGVFTNKYTFKNINWIHIKSIYNSYMPETVKKHEQKINNYITRGIIDPEDSEIQEIIAVPVKQ